MKAGKNWEEKIRKPVQPVVKSIEKSFSGFPAGSKMLISTPKAISEYIRQIPAGENVSVQRMREDLATASGAEFTCPLTTGIFLRVVTEWVYDQWQKGQKLETLPPVWRVVTPHMPLAKKLSFPAEVLLVWKRLSGEA